MSVGGDSGARYRVRSYRPEDRAAIRRICADTGFLGSPIDPVFEDRELFADFLTAPYTDAEPENCFVLEGPTGAGFHFEAILGENANALVGSNNFGESRFFFPQVYVELGLPFPAESVLKVGKYYTLVGYEAADAADNPNFSFSEPSRLMPGSHTGLCLETQWAPWVKSRPVGSAWVRP